MLSSWWIATFVLYVFFFSSRRRHTRWTGDWSSDVCSSDLAGGGLKMGQAVGTTNALAEYPTSKPATPGCVLGTMYHVLGIDHHHVFYDDAKRPLPILSEGEPVAELIG